MLNNVEIENRLCPVFLGEVGLQKPHISVGSSELVSGSLRVFLPDGQQFKDKDSYVVMAIRLKVAYDELMDTQALYIDKVSGREFVITDSGGSQNNNVMWLAIGN